MNSTGLNKRLVQVTYTLRKAFGGLRAKVIMFSAVFIAAIILVGVFAGLTVYWQNTALRDVLLASQQRADMASDSQKYLIDMQRAQSRLIAELEGSEIRNAARNALKALSLMDENIQVLEDALSDNPEVKQLGYLLASVRPALLEVIIAARKNNDEAALAKTREMSDALLSIEKLSNSIVEGERQRLLNTMSVQADEGVQTIKYMGYAILSFVFLALMFSLFAARAIVAPIRQAALVAQDVSEGDLTLTVESTRVDETGILLRAIAVMIESLRGLITQVKGSSVQLVTTATEVSYASKKQEEVSASFGASTHQIAASVNEISATARELLRTMDQVSDATDETASVADQGRLDLERMEGIMQGLSAATATISAKLEEISGRASSIGSVVTTITKVADQTNLLSLNASIEAAKAGEYGTGFAVVAREIRRLADQTAVATLDIERIVGDMQNSVAGGVMEMDRFGKQVSEGVDESIQVSGQLAKIIGSVEALKPQFEMVLEGMQSQASGAGQISEAMVQLKSVTSISEETSDALQSASGQLLQEVEALKVEIARFQVA
jgi:methyl-accepting chemotaxis protein